MSEAEEKSLLRPGQTVAQWWAENGLCAQAASKGRAITYAAQRAATIGNLPAGHRHLLQARQAQRWVS